VTLPYQTNQRSNPGAGFTQTDITFDLGSIYDPDVTGSGHQPRGRDEWAAVYGRYRVLKAQGYVLMRQRASHGIVGRIILSNSSSTMYTTSNLGEFTNSIYMGMTSSNSPPLRKKFTVYPWKLLGLTKAQYLANEDCSALVSASPIESAYMHLISSQTDNATDADVEYEVVIYYTVEFFDRINIPQS